MISRRAWLVGSGSALGAQIVGREQLQRKERRKKLVGRHNVIVTQADPDASLSVGNGEFACTVDVTGLQTFPEHYLNGVPLTMQSTWGWHESRQPEGCRYEDTWVDYEDANGRQVPYPSRQDTDCARWYRENPHRLGLGRIGFVRNGQRLKLEAITNIRQELDLWNGTIRSRWSLDGKPVEVRTCCHPFWNAVAVTVESRLLRSGLAVEFDFPFTSPTYPFRDAQRWEQVKDQERWLVEAYEDVSSYHQLKRVADRSVYFVTIKPEGSTALRRAGETAFHLSGDSDRLTFLCHFGPRRLIKAPPRAQEAFATAETQWNGFWWHGGALDLADSDDQRAGELERRVVLSQYLTTIQCSGTMPPQETGLTGNSWFGKAHGEMHWWHAAHFPLWGRANLLERGMAWYTKVLPLAQEYARAQGYEGARWPKMAGPEGRTSPSGVGAFLIWQQPHIIYFAELLYRENPEKALAQFARLVEETAAFMASYATWDARQERYVLGPPVIPAQESHPAKTTFNPTFELAYWGWALRVAQTWRERRGLLPNEEWAKVIAGLARLPEKDGVYVSAESHPDTFDSNRRDHPSFLGALGFLPGGRADAETMRATLQRVMKSWDWERTWSWDYPLIAMTATRLNEPQIAIDALLMDAPHNRYLPNGHCRQRPELSVYLPGNGGLLAATAMMATWGDPLQPGFPRKGWRFKAEGLKGLL